MKHFHVVNFGSYDDEKKRIENEIFATFLDVDKALSFGDTIAEARDKNDRNVTIGVIECNCQACAKAAVFSDYGSIKLH